MAWHDKDAQKLPRGQVALAYLLFPILLLFSFKYSWVEEEYQLTTLWEYAGVWGRVYVVAVFFAYAAVALLVVYAAAIKHH